MACVPGSMACNGPALGAQAGETKIREVVMAGHINAEHIVTGDTAYVIQDLMISINQLENQIT
jgi:hypothetical protein